MKTTTPQLAPPGEGLPWTERLVAKFSFKLYCATTSTREALTKFQREAALIRLLVDKFDSEGLKKQILVPRVFGIEDSSRNWSVAMLLTHVAMVTKGIQKIVAALMEGHSTLPAVEIARLKPEIASPEESMARFESSLSNYEAFVSNARKLESTITHVHPWFGPLSAHDWHCLAGVHLGIHRRQLASMVALKDRL